MFLHRNNPRFDLAMEVLITLPLWPEFAYINHLLVDLRIEPSQLNKAVKSLEKSGILVAKSRNAARPNTNPTAFAIQPTSWDEAQRLGKAYCRHLQDGD